jgi:hypothetical protein
VKPHDYEAADKERPLKARKRHLNGRSRVFHWDGIIMKKKRFSLITRKMSVNKKIPVTQLPN